MEPAETPVLRMPSFLHGPEEQSVAEAMREGRRCAEQYRREGTLPVPREWVEVPAGEVVVLRNVVDLGWWQPRWRLYSLSHVSDGLREDLPQQDSQVATRALEDFYLGTPWGALYYFLTHRASNSAQREAERLHAVLRFWEPLQSVRYLYNSPSDSMRWDEVMGDACDWVLTAWSPGEEGPLRTRLERGAERMARATREECVEAVLRQVPHAVAVATGVKHPEVLLDLELWRERIAAMDAASFTEMSSAWTAKLLEKIYRWDKQLSLP